MAACSQLSTQSADFKLLAAASTSGRFQSGGHINHMDHWKNAKGLLHQVEPRWWGSLHCSWHPGFAGFPGFATRISVEVSSSDDPLPHVGTFSEPLAPLAALAALTRAGCAGPAAGDGIGVVGALQESYDFAPKFLFHRLVHKLEGSLVLHDALLDGHCILLDGRFGALRIHPALPGEFLQGFDAVLVQIQLW